MKSIKIKSPETCIKSFFNLFDKTDLLILLTVFIIGFITNFYFLNSGGLSPDALSESYFHIAGPWEIQLGRFSLPLLDHLRFGFVNHFIIILIALSFMSGSIILIRRILKLKSRLLIFILTLLTAAAPQFTETYMYLYCADSYLLAFFGATLAVYALTKINTIRKNKFWFLVAIFSTILVSSLYQAYLGVLLGLLIIYTIKEIIETDTKTALKKFLRNCLIIFIGICFYYILFRVFCKINHVRPSAYKGANGLGLETILALPKNILNAFVDFYNFFFAERIIINNNFYFRQFFYLALAIILTLVLAKVIKNRKNSQKIATICLIITFPIFINIMNLIASGTRINLVTGPGLITTFVLLIFLLDQLKNSSLNNLLRWLSSILLIIVAWTFMLSNTHTYIARNDQYSDFKTIMSNIYQKATSLENYKKDLPFLFSNIIDTPAREYEKTNGMITGNTISWTGYAGVMRYEEFFKKFLGVDIKSADEHKYLEIVNTKDFQDMPVYPEANSVKIINDVVVIKVSDQTLINEDNTVRIW